MTRSKAREYRELARECRRLAGTVSTEEGRAHLPPWRRCGSAWRVSRSKAPTSAKRRRPHRPRASTPSSSSNSKFSPRTRTRAIRIGRASALLVAAPFYQHDRPAPRFHTVLESPLADALLAAMGEGLRARGPLLGRRVAVGKCEQWRGQHADEGGCDDKACHNFVLHQARCAGKSYGEIVKRTSVPQPEAPFRCKVFCGPKQAPLRRDLNFTAASDRSRQKCHTRSFSRADCCRKRADRVNLAHHDPPESW